MIKHYKLRQAQNSYEITLFYKGMHVRVAFTGGNTYKGTFPRCITRDPFKQKAIEASQMFKDKDIILERVAEEKEAVKPVNQRRPRASRIVPMKKVAVSGGENAGNVGENAAEVHDETAGVHEDPKTEDPKTEEPGGEAAGTVDANDGENAGNDGKNADEMHDEAAEVQGAGATKMTFDNVGEAILYVAQNFGVETRTEKEARDILKEHGIIPTIKRG